MHTEIQHPFNGNPILGTLLGRGEKVQPGDCYSAGSGQWISPPRSGTGITLRLERKSKIIWVRPVQLSKGAFNLLVVLAKYRSGAYSHLKQNPDREWRIVISQQFSDWGGKTETFRIENFLDIFELESYGYLSHNKKTRVYSLTSNGRERVSLIPK
jgi:hypothetical protein